MTNLEKYNGVFMEVFGASAEELNEGFTFKDVQRWDSVAHLSLISELEDAFDVLFEADDVLHYESYLHGMEILEKYGVEFEKTV